jgi:hypothetical protein
MDTIELGEIIATRSLTRRNSGKYSEILVLIGKPRQTGDWSGFITPFQLRGVGSEVVKYAGGVDAVQSLQLAMKMIGVALEVLNSKADSEIIWDAGEEGDFGFPVA